MNFEQRARSGHTARRVELGTQTQLWALGLFTNPCAMLTVNPHVTGLSGDADVIRLSFPGVMHLHGKN